MSRPAGTPAPKLVRELVTQHGAKAVAARCAVSPRTVEGWTLGRGLPALALAALRAWRAEATSTAR